MRKFIVMLAGILVAALLTVSISSMVMASADTSENEIVVESKEKTRKSGDFRKKDSVNVSVIKVAASVLDITEEEIKSTIKTGKVGDLLAAADKVDEFKTAYLAELKSKLDAAVTAGTLTQEEADAKYASGEEKMDGYDGTTHLCGGHDHSKMSDRKSKKSSSDSNSGL
jgi:mannitol-specific phosphotransferase system IIBC component